jgi:hypothetical protein
MTRFSNAYLATVTLRLPDEEEGLLDSLASSDDSFSNDGFRRPPSSSVLSSSYHGTETDDSLSISVDQDRTPFEQRLHGVEQTIDRLYRLSVAIRRPSIISQNAKAANFVIRDEDGNDVGEQFSDFALAWITHQFPEAALVLRERLARSVTLRRKRFLYRQNHQKKISMKSYLSPPPLAERSRSPGLDAESTVVARTVIEGGAQGTLKQQDTFLKPRLPSQTSASKITGNFKTEDVIELPPSRARTVFSGAFTQRTAIPIPDPPKPTPGSKEFECPYCCMMLPMKEAVRSQWT